MIALVKGFHDMFKDTTGTHFTGIISVICPTALQNEMVALVSQTGKLIFLSLFSNNIQYIEHSSVLSHFRVSPGFFHLSSRQSIFQDKY